MWQRKVYKKGDRKGRRVGWTTDGDTTNHDRCLVRHTRKGWQKAVEVRVTSTFNTFFIAVRCHHHSSKFNDVELQDGFLTLSYRTSPMVFLSKSNLYRLVTDDVSWLYKTLPFNYYKTPWTPIIIVKESLYTLS